MKKRTTGFNIAELFVIIAIVGIIMTIAAMTLSQFHADSRDDTRAKNINSIAQALEKYYGSHGSYPNCYAMTQSIQSVSTTSLGGLNPSLLTAPLAKKKVNSFGCTVLTPDSMNDTYAYIGDGSQSCSNALAPGSCLQFTLQYIGETTHRVIKVQSKHHVDISTTGVPTLVARVDGSTEVDLSWSLVPYASSYRVTMAHDEKFTKNVENQTTYGISKSILGLEPGTTYYFKVQAMTKGIMSPVSRTIKVQTAKQEG